MDSTGLSASGQTISRTESQAPRQVLPLSPDATIPAVSAPISSSSIPAIRPRSASNSSIPRSLSLPLPPLLRSLQCPADDLSDVSSYDLDEDEDEDEDSDRPRCPSCDHFDDPAAVLDADDDAMDDDSALEAKSMSVSSMSADTIPNRLDLGRSLTGPPTIPSSSVHLPGHSAAPSASVGMSPPELPSESDSRLVSTLRQFGRLSRGLACHLTSSPTHPVTASQPITLGDLATYRSLTSTSRGSASASTVSAESECISVHERLCELLAMPGSSTKVVFKEAM